MDIRPPYISNFREKLEVRTAEFLKPYSNSFVKVRKFSKSTDIRLPYISKFSEKLDLKTAKLLTPYSNSFVKVWKS